MKISKRRKNKSFFSILMAIMLIVQTLSMGTVLPVAAASWDSVEYGKDYVPSEVLNSPVGYREVPVYFEGLNAGTMFEKYLRKFNNSTFDEGGVVTFRAKAYAYKKDGDFRVGTCVEFLNYYGRWEVISWVEKESKISYNEAQAHFNEQDEQKIYISDITLVNRGGTDKNDKRIKIEFKVNDQTVSVQSTKNIEFMCTADFDQDIVAPEPEEAKLDVTRKVTKLEDEKNVWDVELKVEGQAPKVNAKTDVVLVLDRSGSMRDFVGDYTRRGALVKNAALSLTDALLAEANVNVGVVSIGGFRNWDDGTIPDQGLQYYNDSWHEIYLSKADKVGDKWAQYTLDAELTRNRYDLRTGIVECMDLLNYHGGTPLSLGIIKAGTMLQSSDATNKVMILISDGAPSFARNGIGTGEIEEDNPGSWDQYIVRDTTFASQQAHERIPNLQLFTVAAGDSIHADGIDILRRCATSDEHTYTSNDTQAALDDIMENISVKVIDNISSETTLKETLNDNISLQVKSDNIMNTIATFDNPDEIDWSKTSIAISQGDITYVDKKNLEWNIGKVTNDKPAIIKYRVYMESGELGKDYDISKDGRVRYKNKDGQELQLDIPNAQIRLYWAEINMMTGFAGVNSVVPNSEMQVWYKVPEDFTSGSMMFGYDTKYNPSTFEVDSSSGRTIRNSIKVPSGIEVNAENVEGVMIDGQPSEFDIMNQNQVNIVKTPNSITTLLKIIQDVEIERTVTEVVDEKNVWEVELKVTGHSNQGHVPTDVVLVLDRSGSMTIRNDENIKRGENVLIAAKNLADKLLSEPNINVAAVSFGGFKEGDRQPSDIEGPDGFIPDRGMDYFGPNWETKTMTKEEKQQQIDIYGKPVADSELWAQYTVDCEFTRDVDKLKQGLDTGLYWKNLFGGTPISMGLIQAGKMLETSEGHNKVIILLSDGLPSYSRDGKGPGMIDEDLAETWDMNAIEDTIKAGKEVHEKIDNVKVFTIAAGDSIKDKGKEVLAECATPGEGYMYSAEDTLESLNGVMDNIANIVIEESVIDPVVEENIISNISIKSPLDDVEKSIQTISITDNATGTTEAVNWGNTALAITQGEVEEAGKHNFIWNVGGLSMDEPAIMKYRINMTEGVIGQSYNISTGSTIDYIDLNDKMVSKEVPNVELGLSWAELNLSTYDNKLLQDVPGSQLTLWHKVPDDFTPGDMNFNYNLKYNSATSEINPAGDKTVESSVKRPSGSDGAPSVVVGVLVDEAMYTEDGIKTDGASILKSPTKIKSLVNEPELSSVTNSDTNFIQPEGVTNISSNVKFNVKSKDTVYIVDTTKIVQNKLNNSVFMVFDRANRSVEVRKVNESNRLLVRDVDYRSVQSGYNTRIEFMTDINAVDEFKIDIYMPTKFSSNVVYGGSTGSTYLNTYKGKTEQVDTKIITTPKLEDTVLDDGTITEVYGYPMEIDSKTKPENKITLTYLDLAGIH